MLDTPWTRSSKEVVSELSSDREHGLSEKEARERRDRFGKNRLRESKTRTWLEILWEQMKSLIVLLLVVAAAVAFLFGEIIEGWAILVVVVINGMIGFFTELRAVQSMESLRELGGVTSMVLRDGDMKEVPAEELVPGDIVKLSEGNLVTADVRVVTSSNLQVDESALTGESVAVEKTENPVPEDTPLAERTSMVYKGTFLTRGEGFGVVVSTGMETELGEITMLVDEAEAEQTPLEKRLDALGRKLVWLVLGIAFIVSLAGITTGRDLFLMIETGIALAVAAVPEGLPIVATIALARGMWRMAEKNALINRLSAVETLGSTTVIFTDKTGTLTENKMNIRTLATGGTGETGRDWSSLKDEELPENIRDLLKIGALCNNASYTESDDGGEKLVGDPMEQALLKGAEQYGMPRDELLAKYPEEREESFSTETKMMGTFHRSNGTFYVAVKGAPEEVLSHCNYIRENGETREMTEEDRTIWENRNRELAGNGLRMLAFADRTAETADENPYNDLVFQGFIGFIDPPRADVREAIKKCKRAGVRVIMVTGDMAETAKNIGGEVGIGGNGEVSVREGTELDRIKSAGEAEKRELREVSIYSRVSPKQKLQLVDLHQENGEIVGMTGDGVNDAPALKKADIGIAMGQRGTQVAREASDMVLTDDAFSTIVSAVEEGRVIFENIRKFVFYLLSCNVSEIMVVGIASVVQLPLPILPLQILFLNLVTDVFPALALGMGEGEETIMDRSPRNPEEPVLKQNHWIAIGLYGIVFTGSVLGALVLSLHWLQISEKQAVTISFLTLAFAQLWHVLNMRDYRTDLFVNDITKNNYVWGALVLCVGLLLGATYIRPLAGVLKIHPPGFSGWAIVFGMSLLPLVYGQAVKSFDVHMTTDRGSEPRSKSPRANQ